MSMGVIGTDIEEALRMNASCVAVQCFIGSASEICFPAQSFLLYQ